MLVVRVKKQQKERYPWRQCVRLDILLKMLYGGLSPHIYNRQNKQKKATTIPNTNRAQMGCSLQIKLHVENSFNPSYCSLKSLKKLPNPWLKLISYLLKYKGIII